jgi:hypothetical protein
MIIKSLSELNLDQSVFPLFYKDEYIRYENSNKNEVLILNGKFKAWLKPYLTIRNILLKKPLYCSSGLLVPGFIINVILITQLKKVRNL